MKVSITCKNKSKFKSEYSTKDIISLLKRLGVKHNIIIYLSEKCPMKIEYIDEEIENSDEETNKINKHVIDYYVSSM